ncbi:hypothetical protein EVAR_54476_1 [Eumeta japonica]|uniref:Uncharacterized protein n=1 Tax=Eumeta variegata TaxID=151549 RepID=A0A4C1YS75_EUMVA|nr:hypothetical protein EVAR_54476_1 [Eumeta japonica]
MKKSNENNHHLVVASLFLSSTARQTSRFEISTMYDLEPPLMNPRPAVVRPVIGSTGDVSCQSPFLLADSVNYINYSRPSMDFLASDFVSTSNPASWLFRLHVECMSSLAQALFNDFSSLRYIGFEVISRMPHNRAEFLV